MNSIADRFLNAILQCLLRRFQRRHAVQLLAAQPRLAEIPESSLAVFDLFQLVENKKFAERPVGIFVPLSDSEPQSLALRLEVPDPGLYKIVVRP